MAETLDHQALKQLAVAWLWRLGCRVVATEVQCPISRYRVDVAGWFDRDISGLFDRAASGAADAGSLWWNADGERRRPSRSGMGEATTIIIECKQSRADFFRDGCDPSELLTARERLERRRREIEETKVKRYEPALCREGSSLFSGLDEWEFSKSKLASYRSVLRELQRVDDALYGQTKFARFVRYRLADRLLLFTPAGMVRPRELPERWGLIECHRRPLRRERETMAGGVDPMVELPLREQIKAPALGADPRRRERLFRTIAIAASRDAVRRIVPKEELLQPRLAASNGTSDPLGQDRR